MEGWQLAAGLVAGYFGMRLVYLALFPRVWQGMQARDLRLRHRIGVVTALAMARRVWRVQLVWTLACNVAAWLALVWAWR